MLRLSRNKYDESEDKYNEKAAGDPRIFEIGVLFLGDFANGNVCKCEQSAVLLQPRDRHDACRRDGIGNVGDLENEPRNRSG